jgi:hypothetical protein
VAELGVIPIWCQPFYTLVMVKRVWIGSRTAPILLELFVPAHSPRQFSGARPRVMNAVPFAHNPERLLMFHRWRVTI